MRLLIISLIFSFSVTSTSGQFIWNQNPDAPFTERDDAVGVTLGDYAYIGTGLDNSFNPLNDWWSYHIFTLEWTALADFPGGARQYASAFALNDRVYVTTGVGNGIYYNDLWEYNPDENVWLQKTSLPVPGRSSCAVFTIGEFAYLCGGYFGLTDHSNEVWRYSPQQDEWTQMTDLPVEVRLAAGFSLQGFGYVAGGFNELSGTLSSTYRYDFSSDSWSQVGNLPAPRLGAKAVGVTNTAFIICGGSSFSELSNSAYWFNQENEQWYNDADFIGAPRKGAVAFRGEEGTFHFGTGIGGPPQNERFNDFYAKYYPYPISVEENNGKILIISPNPAVDIVQVFLSENDRPFQLQITDVRGVVVGEPQQILSGNQFDVSFLSPGIYVLTLIQDEIRYTAKLVKSR
jgi:N-acetylneuraminic acid mutarotase